MKAPHHEDWRKLLRLIQYLHGTHDLALTLQAGENRVVKWWIDAAFAIHSDCKIHSDAAMTLGQVLTYTSSIRQKHNSRSFTEAELVGVN